MTLEEVQTELLRLAEMKEQAAKDCRSKNFMADAHCEESFALAYRTSACLVQSVIDEQAQEFLKILVANSNVAGTMAITTKSRIEISYD